MLLHSWEQGLRASGTELRDRSSIRRNSSRSLQRMMTVEVSFQRIKESLQCLTFRDAWSRARFLAPAASLRGPRSRRHAIRFFLTVPWLWRRGFPRLNRGVSVMLGIRGFRRFREGNPPAVPDRRVIQRAPGHWEHHGQSFRARLRFRFRGARSCGSWVLAWWGRFYPKTARASGTVMDATLSIVH